MSFFRPLLKLFKVKLDSSKIGKELLDAHKLFEQAEFEQLELQLNEISRDFPEYKEKSEIILNMVNLEEKRYQSNLDSKHKRQIFCILYSETRTTKQSYY